MADPDVEFSVDIEGWDPATRRIWGRASAAIPDHENEIIEIEALREALPDFLALPALMYNHTDRPIGLASKAWFTETEFYVEGAIKPTPDCDDVWAAIESGELSQFSIGARRRAGTPACRLRPEARTEPCRTTALDLYSVSLCPRGTAQNPTTFCEIRKALLCRTSETPMPEDLIMNPPEDGPAIDETPEAAPEAQTVITADAVTKLFEMLEKILGLVTPAEIEKGDEDDEGDEPGDEPADDDEIQKAIRKLDARYQKDLATIRKAHAAEIAKLSADIATIRKAKVPKIAVMDLEAARKADHRPGNAAVMNALFRGGN